jgi:hypothetical protein
MCGQDLPTCRILTELRGQPVRNGIGRQSLLLEEAAPLVEAVHHACGARLYDEALNLYRERLEGPDRGLSYQLNAYNTVLSLIIKQTKRVGCGHRNMINYQRRILSHIAVTRPQKSAA